MDSKTAWQQADALLDRLLDLPVAERRAAMEAMGLAPEVRTLVERLLAAHDRDSDILDRPLETDSAQVADDAMTGRRFGVWTVEREIGRGGMAVVYRAHHHEQPERVAALKLVTLGALVGAGIERFRREQSILARLSHPHIVPLFDAGSTDDGTPWLTMALVDGERIDHWCEAHALDARARVRLFLDVCDAVNYAHQNLVVHRDLKPSNVLVDTSGQVRLLDFGIARLADETAEGTATAYRALTPGYAAPEQFTGRPAATTMDVYGLGALLHQLLCGAPPLADQHQPPQADALPRDLRAILGRALATDPSARYPQASPFADDLRAWLDGRAVAARGTGAGYQLGRFVRRHLTAFLVAAVVLALAIAGISATLWQANKAIAANAELKRSLARSSALREYLISLFQVEIPDQPRDMLPTTAQLLERGERLALQSDATDPGVRLDLLDALAQVRTERNDLERAQALVDAAIKLAGGDDPSAAARARLRQAVLLEARSDYDGAMHALEAAQRFLPVSDTSAISDEIALRKAGLLMQSSRFAEALALLQPLLERTDQQLPGNPRLLQRLERSMANTLDGLGRAEQAQPFRERALAAAQQLYGPKSFRSAIDMANVGLGLRRLGRLDEAEARAQAAIAIYDSILDRPSEYRGAAWIGFGLARSDRGDYTGAIEAMDRGNTEFAQARGVARADDYPFFHYNRGITLVRAGRHAEAIVDLTRAIELLKLRGAPGAISRGVAGAWLARALCASGRMQQGLNTLSAARMEIPPAQSAPPEQAAEIEDADAVCRLAAGDPASAVRSLTTALSIEAPRAHGSAAAIADRHLLLARAALALDDPQRAQQEAEQAYGRLLADGLSAHPLAADIASFRAASPAR